MDLKIKNQFILDRKKRQVGKLGDDFYRWCCDRAITPSVKLAVISDQVDVLVEALVGFYRQNTDGVIVRKSILNSELRNLLQSKGYSLMGVDTLNSHPQIIEEVKTSETVCGRISILTSGTTGTPKLIPHSWNTLFTLKGTQDISKKIWMGTYQAGTYAWYQMVTMGLFVPHQQLVFCSSLAPEDAWDDACHASVNALSATPTFWRYLFLKLGTQALSKLALKQITLGGEAADQAILNLLTQLFPEARITHIYASTEAGAAIFVHDGKEGFPVDWLNQKWNDKPLLQVKEGKLWIKTPYAATSVQGWFETGDLAEIRNNRVVIIGRENLGILNVGGQKISTKSVEEVLQQNPAVLWCRVYGKKAPIVGTLVAVDVVMKKEAQSFSASESEWEQKLSQFCRKLGLLDWMVPRIWNFLKDIPLGGNFKSEIKQSQGDGQHE